MKSTERRLAELEQRFDPSHPLMLDPRPVHALIRIHMGTATKDDIRISKPGILESYEHDIRASAAARHQSRTTGTPLDDPYYADEPVYAAVAEILSYPTDETPPPDLVDYLDHALKETETSARCDANLGIQITDGLNGLYKTKPYAIARKRPWKAPAPRPPRPPQDAPTSTAPQYRGALLPLACEVPDEQHQVHDPDPPPEH